jgi:hypothetical protein
MQYIILIYGDEQQFAQMRDPAAQQRIYAEYRTYTAALVEAGVMRGGSELKPTSMATTVRVRNGKTVSTDGPFAETKEQLGGYYLIDVPDLDAAVSWAARCPSAAFGSIEVRPQAQMVPAA